MLRFSAAIGNQLRLSKVSLSNLAATTSNAPICQTKSLSTCAFLRPCRTNVTSTSYQQQIFSTRKGFPLAQAPGYQHRSLSTTAILRRAGIPNHALNEKLRALAFGVLIACGVGERLFGGYNENFYDYRFITTKDPDDLMAFYGGEEFMELFCVIPLMGTLIMRGGYFDDEGTVHTTGLTGKEMLVSMVFSEEEDERDGKTAWFNKRERFREIGFFGGTNWDMIQNFGFHRLPNGKCEVYHQGEYFQGNNGPLSLLVFLVFSAHARFVAWSTWFHITKYAFTSTNEEEEEMEELSRANILWHLVKNEFFGGIRTSIFGKKAHVVVNEDEDDEEEDEEEEEEEVEAPIISVVRRETIAADIAIDRELVRMATESANPLQKKQTKKLTRKNTVGGLLLAATNNPDALVQATANALERHQTRLIRRATAKVEAARRATMSIQNESLEEGEAKVETEPVLQAAVIVEEEPKPESVENVTVTSDAIAAT